jgi:hypothetical protein
MPCSQLATGQSLTVGGSPDQRKTPGENHHRGIIKQEGKNQMSSELPARVRDKLLALRDAEQQALTLTTMTQRALAELDRLLGNSPDGDRAQSTRREIARLTALQPDQQARYRALADLHAKIARYLSLLPASAQITDEKTKIKLKEGETHLRAVQRLRAEIMKLIGERSKVERAVPTNKEAKAAAKEFVQELAKRYPPSLTVEHGKFVVQFGRGVIGERDPTPMEVMAWLDPDLLQARFEQMINDREPSGTQMSAGERKKRLTEIKLELLELERRECAHIDAAKADENAVIEYRLATDPRAILGLVVSEQANAA